MMARYAGTKRRAWPAQRHTRLLRADDARRQAASELWSYSLIAGKGNVSRIRRPQSNSAIQCAG
jgi:hypothetical protein